MICGVPSFGDGSMQRYKRFSRDHHVNDERGKSLLQQKAKVMRCTGRITAICLLLLLAGCVRSLQPLYTEQDLIFDENLIGCWSGEDSDESWCFSKRGVKAYQLVYTDGPGTSGTFIVHLFRINEQVFMDLVPSTGPEGFSQNDFFKFQLVPAHSFAHVKQIEPTLRMRLPEPDWFRKLVEKSPDALRHEKVEREIIVTATTKEMQAFWLKHLDTKGAFGDFSDMKRKAKVDSEDQSPRPQTDDSK
jgi:hypothetical protein